MRNSSLEILRILAVLMIIAMHILGHIEHSALSAVNKAVLSWVNIIGNTGVTCFVLISGYFGVKFKKQKFFYLIVISSLYSVLVEYINNGYDIIEMAKAFLVIPRYKLWFIVCYLFLMILSPYLNKFADMLEKKEYDRLIGTLIIVLCIIPTVFQEAAWSNVVLFQGGKNLTYFLFLYLLGRYIKKYHDENHSRTKLYIVHLSASLLIALIAALTDVLLVSDCSILILISSVSLFLLFKSFVFHSKIINSVSASVLAIYVLNWLYVFFDKNLIHIQEYGTDNIFVLYLLLEVLIVAFVAFAIDKTIGRVVYGIIKKITS